MRVIPLRERAEDLHISKTDAIGQGVMLRNHVLPEWPETDDQFGTIAVRERPSRLPDFDPFPRRKQPLERAGASVPSEQVLGRGGHQTTLDKLRHGLLNREILREFTESGGSYRQFGGTRPTQPVLPAGLGLLVPISTDSIGPP